jgi:diguanylate cyclase (GGDEF)-like protein/PAS domain S-box-containing protein
VGRWTGGVCFVDANDEETWFRQVVDELPDLVCRFAPDGTLRYVNRAYAEYFGSTPAALVGANFLDLVPVDERAAATEALRAVRLLTPADPTRITEHRGGDRDGRARWQEWVDKALFDGSGALSDLLAVGRDVTDRHHAQAMLRHLSERDALTELLNRRAALAVLDEAIASAAPPSCRRLGLVYIDVDDFKGVNDRFGHGAGDRLLVTVGELLAAAFRRTDVIGRIGGDEFVVICPDVVELAELTAMAERFGRTFPALQPPASVSYGTATLESGESASSLLHRADMAMYHHKRSRVPAPA